MSKMTSQFYMVLGLGLAINLASTAQAKKITVMSYNVENLFDTIHDQGKEDYTYLPKTEKRRNPAVYEFCKKQTVRFYREECFNIDWTNEKLRKKLASLTEVLATVNDGKGPDIIAMQEVENINVLNVWMNQSLSKMGYQEVVLLEGGDARGIDGAIVSKFPLAAQPVYHDFHLGLSWDGATSPLFLTTPQFVAAKKSGKRGILEASFNVGGGKELTVMSNHWPSQGNPSSERNEIAKLVQSIAQEVAASGRALVSMGDFNTLDTDHPHGINDWILNEKRKVYFLDARAEYYRVVGSQASILSGSHWYKGEYSALDKIFVLQSTADQLEPDWASFNVINEDFMMTEADTGPHKLKPNRFNFDTAEGYTDHLPITLDLKL